MSDYAYGIHPPGKKRQILYLTAGIVTFLAIAVLFVDIQQNSPQFCSSCHTMRPEYHTWKVSSHSNLGCVDCHRGEGIQGQVELAVNLVRMAESTVLKNYVTPIRMFRSIDDERCFQCHTFNKEATVSGDLIIPHENHTSSNVRCVSCHSGVAHGDIAKRKITQKVSFDQWDTDLGLQEMARELSQPNMSNCMSCHYRRRITTDCSACHTDMYGPESHKLDDFGYNHGEWARAELTDCNTCHGYVGPKKMEVKENTSFVEYTRTNTFCFNCHKEKPPSHEPANFMDIHGKSITRGEKEKDDCLVCHDNNLAEIPMVTDLTCSTCHPARHSKDWRNGHLPPVMPGQKLSYECMSCHSSATCLSCHYLPGYNESGGLLPPSYDPNEIPTDFFM